MSDNTIRDRCHVNTNYTDDAFVGIKFENGEISVHFPMGFHFDDESDDDLRKDILMLIQTIEKTIGHKESRLSNMSEVYTETAFPMRAYLNVIQDYYVRGYYKETEVQFKKAKQGKVDWNRTVKTQKAFVQENEAFYLDLMVRNSKVNDNELITLIHKFCVHESFDKAGWLFTSFRPEKPSIKFNKLLFRSILKEKIAETFNDRNRQLFFSMLAIINYQGSRAASDKFLYGTYRFEYVWEKLIDNVYGISEKQSYFPGTEWHIKGQTAYDSSSLEPDSIMLYREDIYILDAKYYKYGWTLNPWDLPASTSINKQITYGEYTAMKRDEASEKYKVYNAFLIPFDALSKYWKEKQCEEIINIGEALSKWKHNETEYERIQGILIDTKYLMKIVVREDQNEIMKLAEKIKENFM